jgi:hypothetical protein
MATRRVSKGPLSLARAHYQWHFPWDQSISHPKRCRRISPVFGLSHQSFSTRIVVQIVEFGLPESFGLNFNWMTTGLPNSSFPVFSIGGAKRFAKTSRRPSRFPSGGRPTCMATWPRSTWVFLSVIPKLRKHFVDNHVRDGYVLISFQYYSLANRKKCDLMLQLGCSRTC